MQISSLDTGSIQFVLFGLAVALVLNLTRSYRWRSTVLLIASLIFIGLLAQDALSLVPLGAFLLLGYGGLILVERGYPRALSGSVVAVLLTYIWLKKYTFIPAGMFLNSPYFLLGISYILFRVLHLLIEAGNRQDKRHIGLGAYLVYTLNFTTFVSGPIQRYEAFAQDQFTSETIPLGSDVIGLQLERIVRGFFKVNVLATLLQAAQQDALASLSQPLPASSKLFASVCLAVIYPFFLYANFSGYIDIVIALARLMRVRLPENFDRPFSASSFLDFWNRWHITLSTWLKTYVYNPLLITLLRHISSSSLEPYLGLLCFFITFFLVGIWHGRTSEFVAFGILQGGGISINKLWQLLAVRRLGRKGYKRIADTPLYVAFGRGLTFSWFAFTLFLFWARWDQISRIVTAISAPQWLTVWLAVWMLATVVLALWEWLRAALLSVRISSGPVLNSSYARVIYASALGLAAFVMVVLLTQPAPDIVYKAF